MNIDFPAKPSIDPGELKAGMDAILDRARECNLNAIILQVRPCGDSLYPSDIAPWSSYLSGLQGLGPEGGYDPLEAWIQGARLRGMSIYAWINPFRVGAPSIKAYAPTSIVHNKPEYCRVFSSGYIWLDPGLPEVRDYLSDIIAELASGYALDGLFLDDYFYPNPEHLGDARDFPDQDSYAAYRAQGGTLEKPDWRRENSNLFLRQARQALEREAPCMALGLSPAGIWRPGYPQGIRGRDAYAESYADSRLWANEGYADIFSPQLYWPISQIPQSFPLLLRFWHGENREKSVLWPSLLATSPRLSKPELAREIINQIQVSRAMAPKQPGFILYGYRELAAPDSLLAGELIRGPLSTALRAPALDQ